MVKIFIILLTIFISTVKTQLTIKIPCTNESVLQMDENIMKLGVLGNPNGKYPSNDEEARSHCKEDTRMVTWGMNYSSTCMTGRKKEVSRSVTRLLMNSMFTVSKKRCKSVAARKRFIEAGKCGNHVLSDTIKCYNQYSLESEQINRSKNKIMKDQKHWLPVICCTYHKFFDCISDVYAQPANAKECPNRAVVELEGWIRDSLYGVIQYLCGDYQSSSDKCDKMLEQYKDVFTTVRVKSKDVPKSPLGPSNQVFDSLDDVPR